MYKKFYLGIAVLLILIITVIAILNVQKLSRVGEEYEASGVGEAQIITGTQGQVSEEYKDKKFFTLEEVSKHNTKEDCWMVIEGRVYDVTNFIASGIHPPVIEIGCGKDATRLFKERKKEDGTIIGSGTPHSKFAEKLLENYYIGELAR